MQRHYALHLYTRIDSTLLRRTEIKVNVETMVKPRTWVLYTLAVAFGYSRRGQRVHLGF
jgi:hypothetical protein